MPKGKNKLSKKKEDTKGSMEYKKEEVSSEKKNNKGGKWKKKM